MLFSYMRSTARNTWETNWINFFAKCLLTFSFTSNTLTTFYIKQILENVWKTYFDLDDTKITKYCWYFKTSWSDFTYSHWFHFLFQSMDSSRKSRPWNAKANVYSPWQPSHRRAVDAKGKALKLFSKYISHKNYS